MNPPNLDDLQKILHYQFKNLELLQTSLTHRSSLNEQGVKESNERLEFLGDAVLELLISDFLYHEKPNDPEGILTTARSVIVKTDSLAQIARNLNLGAYLKMSKGEAMTGGRENPSLLENSVEALIGAIYKDGGLTEADRFVHDFILPQAREILSRNQLKDAKSLLQEKVQSIGYPSPLYQVISESGPDHNKIFEVAVIINGQEVAKGSGRSKQESEQAAAKLALNLI